MHPCPSCQAPLAQGVPFCGSCGQQIQWVVPPAPPPVEPPADLRVEAPPRGPPAATEPPVFVAPPAEPPVFVAPPVVTAPPEPPRAPPAQRSVSPAQRSASPEPPAPAFAPPARVRATAPQPPPSSPERIRPSERLPPSRFEPPTDPAAPPAEPPPHRRTLSGELFHDVPEPTGVTGPFAQTQRLPPPGSASAARPTARSGHDLEDPDGPALDDATAPHAETQSQGQAVRRVAPLWRRCGAWTVDFALLAALLTGFFSLAAKLVHHGAPSRLSGLDWLAETVLAYGKLWVPALLLFSILTVGYLAIFTALGGQTPGKRAFGLEVVDSRGELPGLVRSLVRACFALGSGLFVLMGFLLALLDRRHQALHDKLAGTYVVCRS